MATIGELFCDKHSQDALIGVIAVPPTATVIDATGVMNAHGIGAVLVMDGLHPVGIFTERDVLRRIVAAGNSPEDTLLRDVMTRDLVFCSLDDEVDAVADIMRSKRIRHVPVLDAEGFVVGMVSIGDINAFRLASFEVALHQIESYVYSRN
jgi:CBS domain-containing protein